MLDHKKYYRLVGVKPDEIYPNVKKVFIKRNIWDNYGLFVGTKKVLDGADKNDLLDRCKEIYPNAEIIDKTI